MAEITAQRVNELRNRTGLPMMKCKQLLTAAGGDVEKAFEQARKEGLKDSIRERAATEGRVAVGTSANRKAAAAVEVVCNTDFTAKSEAVERIANLAVKKLLANPNANAAEDAEIKAQVTAVGQQTGENVQLGRTAVVGSSGGTAGSYLYSTAGKGKIGVLMSLGGDVSEDVVRNLGMHIAAARPIALTREQVPQDLLGKEREIAIEQAKATGKPQNIAEKIAEGKMNAFFAERVLLDQEFVNAEVFKGTVANMLKARGVKLEKFVRLEVGQ
ncbi:MAG TPA: translation elongation factor Ts [Tepidisphaeraceae bacterium]|nr:translation elongation factor Ts [Tepidisphaeraceae bacterium]